MEGVGGEWDIIILLETWVDKRNCEKIKRLTPNGYNWQIEYASKRNRKGRAMNGIVVGVRLGIEKGGDRRGENGEEVMK